MDPVVWIYIILFFFGIFFIFIFLIMHYKYRTLLYESPPVTNFPTISILVPAYNEQSSLRNTIEALQNVKYPERKKEIIIVNDGSKDATSDIGKELSEKYFNVKILNKPNSGKADSLNQALKIANGELIAVVDADSYPQPNAIERMVGHFAEPKVSAVTSRVLVQNKKNWLGKFQVMDYSIIAWTRKLLDFVDSVYVTNGPLSIYRKDVIDEIGGFDTKNLTEDIEITWHMLNNGYQTRMSYDAIVYTTVPEDLKTWIRQRVRWNLGGLQTVQKYYKTMFRKSAFGYFVVPYVSASFALALVGFLLLLRLIWIKGVYYIVSAYYLIKGYSYFEYIDFSINLTVLLLMGGLFFMLAIIYYKTGFRNSETGKKNVFMIVAYSFFYRSLYTIPLIIALYKLAKGDIRWYTK